MADQDSKNDTDGKVVEFPLHRARKPGEVAPKKDGESTEPKTPEQKRRALVVSLISAFVVALFFSHHSGRGRSPQSIDTRPDLASDIKTAEHLNETSLREPASGGHIPAPLDDLRFGILKNRYAIKCRFTEKCSAADALKSVVFNPAANGKAVVIGDSEQFLKKYGELFRVPFDDVQGSHFHDANHSYEVFMLLRNAQVVARVNFTYFHDGTLESINIEPVKNDD